MPWPIIAGRQRRMANICPRWVSGHVSCVRVARTTLFGVDLLCAYEWLLCAIAFTLWFAVGGDGSCALMLRVVAKVVFVACYARAIVCVRFVLVLLRRVCL